MRDQDSCDIIPRPRRVAVNRQRTARRTHGCAPPSPDGREIVASSDGAVTFTLQAIGARLFVQRTQRQTLGLMAIQCLLIDSHAEFRRWCEVEPARFDHPVVFDRLRRYGDEVLGRQG